MKQEFGGRSGRRASRSDRRRGRSSTPCSRLPELASDLENSRTGPARAMADRLRARSDRQYGSLRSTRSSRPDPNCGHGCRARKAAKADRGSGRRAAVPLSQLVDADDARPADRRRRQRLPRSRRRADGVAGVRQESAAGDVLRAVARLFGDVLGSSVVRWFGGSAAGGSLLAVASPHSSSAPATASREQPAANPEHRSISAPAAET